MSESKDTPTNNFVPIVTEIIVGIFLLLAGAMKLKPLELIFLLFLFIVLLYGHHVFKDNKNKLFITTFAILLIGFLIIAVTGHTLMLDESTATETPSPTTKESPSIDTTPVDVLTKAATSTEYTGVCYYDWKELNRSTDSSGNSYITIKLYIKNDATIPIDTYPVFWRLNADGQVYPSDKSWSNLSSDEHFWVKLAKGGVAETRLQYYVKWSPSIDDVVNTEVGAPKIQRINYY